MTIVDDFAIELCITDGWTDITTDVRADPKVSIQRGRTSESGQVPPSTCTMTLDNRTGKFSPRNPVGLYYGKLGRNTPLRVARRVGKDTFTRSVSSGWGTADVGGPWTLNGTASKFNVTGTAATMTFAAANDSVFAYQATQLFYDVDVSCSVTVPFSNVTGASVEPMDLLIGGVSTSDFFEARLLITTAEVMTLDITHIDGTSVVAPVTVSSFAFTGQQIRMRFQRDGQTLRAKVWPAASPEPYAWQCEGRTDRLFGRAQGWVGVRAAVPTGNTNVPFSYSFDNFDVRVNRFFGEVANWPTTWDLSGDEAYTEIEAAGIRRRLGQGLLPLKSTYLRGNQTISPAPVAYWPVEDGNTATSIASGIGGSPMSIDGGAPNLSSNSDFACSAPIGVPNTSRWFGLLGSIPSTGSIQVMFLLSIPEAGDTDQVVFVQLRTNGSLAIIDVFYDSATGFIWIKSYDQLGAFIAPAWGSGAHVKGVPVLVSLELVQSGSDVVVTLATLQPGAPGGFAPNHTYAGKTVGSPSIVFVNPNYGSVSSAIGHISCRTDVVSIFALRSQLAAYAGETANARMLRLCGENNIPFTYTWNGVIADAKMGTQDRSTVLDLLDEATTANADSLHDNRNALGFLHRSRTGMYNQPATLALDYSTDGVTPPVRPIEDDQNLRNDITVIRKDGSSYEAIQTTGPLAVTEPASGVGAGRYADSQTLNLYVEDQLVNAATWLLHLGTVDEPRYPAIRISIAPLPLSANAQKTLDALAINLDDRITIANSPWVDPGTISQIVRGYHEEFDGIEHDIVFNCAPASPYEVAVADDAARGKADSAGSYVVAAATSAAVSLLVGTQAGHLSWTTDPAQCPIPITVSGEAMSTTAIAANVELLSNVGFESTLSPWAVTGATCTQSGTQKHSGSFAARIVPSGVAAQAYINSELLPCMGGSSVTVTGWVWFTNAVTTNFSLTVNFFDSAGVFISASSALVSAPATTWTQVTNVFTAPANTAFCNLNPILSGTPAAGQIWYADDLSVKGGGVQQFTVTRSVNGIVKAQAAGAQVRLTRPSVAAL